MKAKEFELLESIRKEAISGIERLKKPISSKDKIVKVNFLQVKREELEKFNSTLEKIAKAKSFEDLGILRENTMPSVLTRRDKRWKKFQDLIYSYLIYINELKIKKE